MKKEEIEKLKETLYEEIRKKDKIIDELTKKNEILLKTALRKATNKVEEEEMKKYRKDKK